MEYEFWVTEVRIGILDPTQQMLFLNGIEKKMPNAEFKGCTPAGNYIYRIPKGTIDYVRLSSPL